MKRITKYSASELNLNRTLSLIINEARTPKKAKKIDIGKKWFAKRRKKSGVTEVTSYEVVANWCERTMTSTVKRDIRRPFIMKAFRDIGTATI